MNETQNKKIDLYDIALKTEDAVEFFRDVYSASKAINKNFSYNRLAKVGGIASPSYLREVLAGKRNITYTGFFNICKAFKLDENTTELLRLYLALKDDNFNTLKTSKPEIKKDIQKLRTLIYKKVNYLQVKDVGNDNVSAYQTVQVMAALGKANEGATIPEISSRTKLYETQILLILEQLVNKEIVNYSPLKNRYSLRETKVLFDSTNEESFMKKLYIETLEKHARKAKDKFKNPQTVRTAFLFSANEERMEIVRQKIKQAIADIVDEEEDPEGSNIYSMVLGFAEA